MIGDTAAIHISKAEAARDFAALLASLCRLLPAGCTL